MAMHNDLTAINQEIEKLLHGLGQEGLLDDQFAQLMQLQVCFLLPFTFTLLDALVFSLTLHINL